MYKCKSLWWGWSYHNEWLWEIKETPKSFMLKCIKTGDRFREWKAINIKKEYYPQSKLEDLEIIIYIWKEWIPYIFNEINSYSDN
jgi:hypothetical protein